MMLHPPLFTVHTGHGGHEEAEVVFDTGTDLIDTILVFDTGGATDSVDTTLDCDTTKGVVDEEAGTVTGVVGTGGSTYPSLLRLRYNITHAAKIQLRR
jgi:hypothetical protein